MQRILATTTVEQAVGCIDLDHFFGGELARFRGGAFEPVRMELARPAPVGGFDLFSRPRCGHTQNPAGPILRQGMGC